MPKSNYNTFVVINCKARVVELVTSSARKADALFDTGCKVEVWNSNGRVETIRSTDRRRERSPLGPYIDAERDYIAARQAAATTRNRRRKK